jgi:hypothetical protein
VKNICYTIIRYAPEMRQQNVSGVWLRGFHRQVIRWWKAGEITSNIETHGKEKLK